MNEKALQFEYLSDLFEYGDKSPSALIRCGNCVIIRTQYETDRETLESMFHALYTLVVYRNLAPFLDFQPIIRNRQRFDRECMGYFCAILRFTGNRSYLPLIAEICRKFPDIDEYEEDRTELEYRSNHMKKGILFDLDGTLWDSSKEVVRSWNHTILTETDRKEQFTVADMHRFMGKTLEEIAGMMFPSLPAAERERILRLCNDKELVDLAAAETHPVLYDDEHDIIRRLQKDYVLGIVSNCQDGYIETYLNQQVFADAFSDRECAGRTGLSKGRNIRLVMERQGITDCIYVGDTQGDADAAKEAGIPFVHAAYGFGTVDACAAALRSFRELPETAAKLFCN